MFYIMVGKSNCISTITDGKVIENYDVLFGDGTSNSNALCFSLDYVPDVIGIYGIFDDIPSNAYTKAIPCLLGGLCITDESSDKKCCIVVDVSLAKKGIVEQENGQLDGVATFSDCHAATYDGIRTSRIDYYGWAYSTVDKKLYLCKFSTKKSGKTYYVYISPYIHDTSYYVHFYYNTFLTMNFKKEG